MQDKEKENAIQDEAREIVKFSVIFNANEIIEIFSDYAANCPEKAPFDQEDFYPPFVCPVCGSIHYSNNDEVNQEIYICDDCGAKFDDPDFAEIFEYWAMDDFWARRLEEKGEVILRIAGLPPVWGRQCTGQAIYLDGVFQNLARELVEEREQYKARCAAK